METIYFDKCHHFEIENIRSHLCYKRYYDIQEPFSWEKKRLIVCDELIRLKLRNKIIEKDSSGLYCGSQHIYKDVIDELIEEAFPAKYRVWNIWDFGTPMNPTIMYSICERPHILRYIKLNNALKLIFDYGFNNCDVNFRNTIKYSLEKTIKRALYNAHINRSKQKQMQEILKRLIKHNSGFYDKEYEKIILTLFIDFLEVQSTFKL